MLKQLGTLRPETDAERALKAKVTEADVAELKSRMAAHKTAGDVLTPEGLRHTTSAAQTRALMAAEGVSSGVSGEFMAWLEGQNQ